MRSHLHRRACYWALVNSKGSMHVIAFAPSLRAVLDQGGGVTAAGFPMTSCTIGGVPTPVSIPVVLAVWAPGGTDYDPRRYIVATSPDGKRVSSVECAWHWPDKPGAPVKFWVLVRELSMVVESAGVYTIGLYDGPDATKTDHLFPLPVFTANPLAPPPQATARR